MADIACDLLLYGSTEPGIIVSKIILDAVHRLY